MEELIKKIMPFIVGIFCASITVSAMVITHHLLFPKNPFNWLDGSLLGWFANNSFQYGKNIIKQ